MAKFLLPSLVLLALATCLAAVPGESSAATCATVAWIDPDSGIGGTGLEDPDSGIGGTGLEDPDSGIGGTGIFGTITGFASVCINGLEIHYDADVPVTANGEPASAADLAVGRVVWIVASERDGHLVATSIAMLSALIGLVDAVDPERGLFRVNGEIVEVPPTALVLGQTNGPIEPGVRVDVSGLRRPDGRVVATRIDLARPEPRRASMPSVEALLRTAPGLSHLSIEGFAGTRVGPDRFDLDGIEVETRREFPGGAGSELRMTVEGPLRKGVLQADRLTVERVVPERPERPAESDPRPARELVRPEHSKPIERPERPPQLERIERPVRIDSFKPSRK